MKKNPFLDFQAVPVRKKEIPLDRIVQAKQAIMDRIMEGYLSLVEEEVKGLVWLVGQSHEVRTYNAALRSIQDLQYDQDDIEELCAELDRGKKTPYLISGPAGIYLSALINQAPEDRILLRLQDFERTFHFLGYRLPEGKTLILQGNVGDFVGASVCGGRLVVEGSAGNWCGAGMTGGEILVTGHTGQKTGEWMRGGTIQVDGRIWGMGQSRFGGEILHCGKPIAPLGAEEHSRPEGDGGI
ncbi:MAG: hypothetical protein MUO52_00870 [Desulfobacterales bacterium]|nr:hypothetical protein [Desulfobacterales bacterium]